MKYFFLICCLGVLSCKKSVTPSPLPIVDLGSFEKQGHRGCRGLMPENTIPAMLKAVDLGVTNLEMDLAITKDNKVIVSHDPYFNDVVATKPNGQYVTTAEQYSLNMYQMTYDQVKTFDVGLRPVGAFPQQQKMAATVPLLADLVDSVEAYGNRKGLSNIVYNIEIKSNPFTDGVFYPVVADYAELVMAVVKIKSIQLRVNISSFDMRALQYLHQKYPAIKTTLNSNDMANFDNEISALGFYPASYSPLYSTVTTSLIDKAHKSNIKVVPFTVDDKPAIDNLKTMGVNGIITDYPNLLN